MGSINSKITELEEERVSKKELNSEDYQNLLVKALKGEINKEELVNALKVDEDDIDWGVPNFYINKDHIPDETIILRSTGEHEKDYFKAKVIIDTDSIYDSGNITSYVKSCFKPLDPTKIEITVKE